jgi:hypothetical protein
MDTTSWDMECAAARVVPSEWIIDRLRRRDHRSRLYVADRSIRVFLSSLCRRRFDRIFRRFWHAEQAVEGWPGFLFAGTNRFDLRV